MQFMNGTYIYKPERFINTERVYKHFKSHSAEFLTYKSNYFGLDSERNTERICTISIQSENQYEIARSDHGDDSLYYSGKSCNMRVLLLSRNSMINVFLKKEENEGEVS